MLKPMFNVAGWAVFLAVTMMCVAGCVDENGSGSRAVKTAKGAAGQPSLFAGTEYAVTAPQALSLNRDLSRLFVKQQASDMDASVIRAFDLAKGLVDPVEYLRTADPVRAYVQAHPTAEECLIITNVQDQATGQVRDAIWRLTPAERLEVDYLSTPGLPVELPPDSCYSLSPIYSWDGSCIIVPLHGIGMCVFHIASSEWRLAPYPQIPGAPTGQSQAALPDSEGSQLVYVSRWQIGHQGEWCQVNVLNLHSGEWVRNFEISAPDNPTRQWVIYSIAGSDLINEPWLVHGGRAPQVNTEKARVPRLAKVDPVSGHVELLMFHGEPYWPMALDPLGRYVVYLDLQRQAIVRLDTEEPVLDYDPRWYSDEAQVFVAPGAETVYVWNKTEFVQARFTKHEEVKE